MLKCVTTLFNFFLKISQISPPKSAWKRIKSKILKEHTSSFKFHLIISDKGLVHPPRHLIHIKGGQVSSLRDQGPYGTLGLKN